MKRSSFSLVSPAALLVCASLGLWACKRTAPPESAVADSQESPMPSPPTAGSGQPAPTPAPAGAATPATGPDPALFVGEVNPQDVLDHLGLWAEAFAQVSPDRDTALALARVPGGAEVEVYFGVWCGDCQRELPRFWKALNIAEEIPFGVRHVGMDRQFLAGAEPLHLLQIEAIPTFIVKRDGKEVGRIVETSPNGIERDLLDLLMGKATGKISATR